MTFTTEEMTQTPRYVWGNAWDDRGRDQSDAAEKQSTQGWTATRRRQKEARKGSIQNLRGSTALLSP